MEGAFACGIEVPAGGEMRLEGGRFYHLYFLPGYSATKIGRR